MHFLLSIFSENWLGSRRDPAAQLSRLVSAARTAPVLKPLLLAAGLLTLWAAAGCEQTKPTEAARQVPPATPPLVAVPAPVKTPPARPRPDSAAANADSLHTMSRSPAAAATASALPAKPAAPVKSRLVGMRDTVGNGKAARLLGGAFDPYTLRYRHDPAVPLMLKLARRTTLMVGVNSSESRLYHLFADPKVSAATLANPLALDRLTFEPGQAILGAEAAQQLGNLAALLHTFPQVTLTLSGHSATTEPQFWKLGNARGRACLVELLKLGVAPTRLRTEWLAPKAGDPHPQGLSVRVMTH